MTNEQHRRKIKLSKRKLKNLNIKKMIKAKPSKSFKITYHSNPFVIYDRDGNVVQDTRK